MTRAGQAPRYDNLVEGTLRAFPGQFAAIRKEFYRAILGLFLASRFPASLPWSRSRSTKTDGNSCPTLLRGRPVAMVALGEFAVLLHMLRPR
jgi:hypothetical protein